jgi:1-phosphofructokinase
VWSARPPRIAVRSTVGAGDCSLAGYLLADLAGQPPAERLRSAVAYGAASASLPGSAVPTPAQVDGPAVRVTAGFAGTGSTAHPVPATGRDAS